MIRLIIVAISIFLICSVASATTYYVCDTEVDCDAGAAGNTDWETGVDTTAGGQGQSRGLPWKTIDYAEENVSAGDTVIVGDGTYNTDSAESTSATLFIETSGSSGNWITFKAENLWGATIQDSSGGHSAIWIDSADTPSYIRIEDFEIEAAQFGVHGKDDASPYTRADYIYLYRLKIHNISGTAITIREADNVTIDRCIIYDVRGEYAMYISDHTAGWLVKNNIAYDTNSWTLHMYSHGQGIQENHVIINNTFIDDSTTDDGILIHDSSNITVRNNIIYNASSGGRDYMIECDTGDSNLLIENNLTNLGTMQDGDCTNDFDGSTCGTGDPADCNTLSADLSDEFTSHATRDYTQQSDALSKDTGTSTGAPSEDYAGNDRPVNSLYDIGAYEYGTDLGFTGVTVQ